jgi:predicted ThiF/HesA family dinucleotide-utilizing enzyme
MRFLFFFLSVSIAHAEISSDILIRGKIGSSFDENKVEVIDSFGQKYFLPRSAFPKDFVVREGTPFSVEVDEKEIENQKIKVKK